LALTALYSLSKQLFLDSNLRIVLSESVHFDSELPHYKTKDGVYRDPSGNGRVVSSPLMWIEALNLVLNKLKKAELKFDKVRAISGSGQQHSLINDQLGSRVDQITPISDDDDFARAVSLTIKTTQQEKSWRQSIQIFQNYNKGLEEFFC